MLYLMMDKKSDCCLVKVGYSDGIRNIKTRRKSYYSYNPFAIMRSSCAGSTAMEKECRQLLTEWGGERIIGTEWFVVSEQLFNELYNQGMKKFGIKTQIHFLEEFEKKA